MDAVLHPVYPLLEGVPPARQEYWQEYWKMDDALSARPAWSFSVIVVVVSNTEVKWMSKSTLLAYIDATA